MKDGICPKCGSSQVFKRKSGGHVIVWLNNLFHYTYPMNYVCSSCGYVEWYIEERKSLDYIREKWDRATKRKNDG